MEKKRQTCGGCDKTFADISNLRKHVKKDHGNDPILKQFKYKAKHLYAYNCYCGRNFSRKKYLTYHLKSHSAPENKASAIHLQKCPLCDFKCRFEKDLLSHFATKHDVVVRQENLEFDSFEEFEKWKNNMENETSSRYITLRSYPLPSGKYIKYACNRSGYYSPSVQNRVRSLKTQGSNKINGICPAAIILQISEDGKCTCKFTRSHIGHNSDVGHLYLSPLERKICAEKVASQIPFSVILDQVRDSVSDSNLHRLHLLTRKDLHNIKKSYNLCSEAMGDQSDATSVQAWVNEMNQEENTCVLFYKPQDTIAAEHSELKKDDFILIIMNHDQCEILKKFGSDCICLDSTHGTDSYDFQLTTLMIIDDMRQGFPCAFLLSNRLDEEVLEVFFFHVRRYSNIIAPQVFMTDIAESFYNAWVDVMAKPVTRLYCSWHIDQAWRKNLTKIKIRDKQIEVYKILRTVMEERDVTAFCKMRDELCISLLEDPNTQEFGEYFINDYTQNCESWAYCFRLNAGVDTNMHLERMHRTIKHIYLDGKRVRRLDKAMCAIMKFIKDRLSVLGKETEEPIQEENTDFEILFDDEAQIEIDFITSQITIKTNNKEDSSVTRVLERLKLEFLDSLKDVKTMAQVDVVKKCIAPIKRKLQALKASSSQDCI